MKLKLPWRKKEGLEQEPEREASYPPPDGAPWKVWYDGWSHSQPPAEVAVEIWRKEWREPKTIIPANMSPWMNVAGLYWRALPKNSGIDFA
jgi:hypothetical protein